MGRFVVGCGLLATLLGCGSAPPKQVDLEPAWVLLEQGRDAEAAEMLTQILRDLKEREVDFETQLARFKIHVRLYDERTRFEALPPEHRGPYRAPREHLAHAARLCIDLLTIPCPDEHRREASALTSRYFTLKALNPSLRMGSPGANPGIERYLLHRLSAFFAAHASSVRAGVAAQTAAARLSNADGVSSSWRAVFRALSIPRHNNASDRAFLRLTLERHLEEGGRSQDQGTVELTLRGDARQALRHYLDALMHYALVRECAPEPSIGEEVALSAMPVVYEAIGRLGSQK